MHVFNRTRAKADPLIEMGAQWSDNPLADCDRVVISLYTSRIVEQVLQDLQPGLHAGQILLDTTTGDPNETTALGNWLGEQKVAYLETPIAASSEQTRQGEAVAIVAGPREAYEQSHDLLAAMAAKSYHVGPWAAPPA